MINLSPIQQQAFNRLKKMLPISNIFVVYGESGLGKTAVLRAIHQETGGILLTIKDFMDALSQKHPLALEETFQAVIIDALQQHDTVILDDFDLINSVTCCNHFYSRKDLLNAPIMAICQYTIEANKKLIIGESVSTPEPISQRAYFTWIKDFQVADYQHICQQHLNSDVASSLSYEKIHRFAPKLNAHQLKSACLWLKDKAELDTDYFIEYLRSQRLGSNVDLNEVREVDLSDLKGVDEIIESLEANIVLPFENDALATELGLKAKRGVLLVGPPGTGKTTIGRALAHRLKSKFFLIDGTFIAGTDQFYQKVSRVFKLAKQNAPSIIFIDDSDAIFESGEEQGLYRYLLTMLDGLESESNDRICIMLTAMNVAHLPPALIRSGRIELWLEMHLPDEQARHNIIQAGLNKLSPPLNQIEMARVVESTAGFTGADLKRLIEDTKALFAYDKIKGLTLKSSTEYFLVAIEKVRENKARYVQAEESARQQQARRSQR